MSSLTAIIFEIKILIRYKPDEAFVQEFENFTNKSFMTVSNIF